MFKLKNHNNRNPEAGFTLLEILISIAMIAIMAGVSVPIFQSLQTRNDLDISAVTLAHSLRRAQVLARASDGDTSWGVRLSTGTLTIFKGANYAGRDSTFDEVYDFKTSIAPSGISEIVFNKFIGLPNVTGTIVLTSTTNETRNITINEKGAIG